MIPIRRPNRFRIVTNSDEVDENGGLYYFNPGLNVSAYDNAQGDVFLKVKDHILKMIEDKDSNVFTSDLVPLVEGMSSVTPYLLSRGEAFEAYELGANPIMAAGNSLYALGHKAKIGRSLGEVLTLGDHRTFLYVPELIFLMSLTETALFSPSKVESMIQWFASSQYIETVDIKFGLSKWQIRRVTYRPTKRSREISISFFDMKRILEMNEALRKVFTEESS